MSFISHIFADYPQVLTMNDVANALCLPVEDIADAVMMGQLTPTIEHQKELTFDRATLVQQIENLRNTINPMREKEM